ncbi:hypothetical protein [Huintestinicola sp.]
MIKNTEEMEQEITRTDNIYDLIDNSSDVFRSETVSEYLKTKLAEKGMKAAEAVRRSEIDRCYGQQIISGIRTPSRDKLIAVSFGIGLCLDEVNELMKISCNRPLYSRDKRDAVIIYGISNSLDIGKVNEILYEKGIDIIE